MVPTSAADRRANSATATHQNSSSRARNRFAARALDFSDGSSRVVHVERDWNDRTDINQQWDEVERGSKAAPSPSADDREQQARVRKLGRAVAAERSERRREEWWRQEDAAQSIPAARTSAAAGEAARSKPAAVPGPEPSVGAEAPASAASSSDPVQRDAPASPSAPPIAPRLPVHPDSDLVYKPQVDQVAPNALRIPTGKMMVFDHEPAAVTVSRDDAAPVQERPLRSRRHPALGCG